ncbi:MAG: bifunctional histidinol-phosphatase/imidazoleglycerol-phosphate dehydratase HisB [Bacteroidales bacterium]|nr:bifunctional histidinol-phosphatase/imidazoleglycerol-phosphate dehydratase HisB [Bacteroidales bacterium]
MSRKVLFIDRDGTLIKEPPDEQVDSFEKLEFCPKVIKNLIQIKTNLDFELVMVTNQDGMGTPSFPEDKFWPVQNFVLGVFKNEGVEFDEILIDRSFPSDNLSTRKPGIGLLTKYFKEDYNLTNSYVIGDRLTDVELAKNAGAKAILLNKNITVPDTLKEYCKLITDNWDEIYEFLRFGERTAKVNRITKETEIFVTIDLDGTGKSDISTGLGFFDHMLEQIAKHSVSDLTIKVKGDLKVDEHHTIEDTALALGEAVYNALGSKRGIERYGFVLPMDESIAEVALDFGGRNWLVWKTDFKREKIGEMPTEMFIHFFKSFTDTAKCNLYIKAEGENEHHKIEAVFKAFAKAIKNAKNRNVLNYELPSTKGVI